MSEKVLRELVNEVKKSNELLEEIRTALSSIDTEVGVLGDMKLDLEAIRSELASIATSRTRKPYARARCIRPGYPNVYLFLHRNLLC